MSWLCRTAGGRARRSLFMVDAARIALGDYYERRKQEQGAVQKIVASRQAKEIVTMGFRVGTGKKTPPEQLVKLLGQAGRQARIIQKHARFDVAQLGGLREVGRCQQCIARINKDGLGMQDGAALAIRVERARS